MVIYTDSSKIQFSNCLVTVPCLTGSSSQATDPTPHYDTLYLIKQLLLLVCFVASYNSSSRCLTED